MTLKVNEKSKHLIELTKSKLFEAIVPTYILDESYHFMIWNKSFEELVAKPLGLEIGMHAVEFVNGCENRKEILERSAKVFALGKNAVTDHESLIYKSKTYGKIEFHKLASAIHFKKEDEIAWVVSLNISSVEKKNEFFTNLMTTIERTVHHS